MRVLVAFVLVAHAAAAEPGSRCAECHPRQVASYAASGMARALGRLRDGEWKDVAGSPVRCAAQSYSLVADEHGARIVESLVRITGTEESHVEVGSAPVMFAIGAGDLDRSFAVRRGELLRFAPVEVVRDPSSGARHAQLAPGHAIRPDARWSIPIAEECLRCHTSALPPRDRPYDVAPPPDWNPSGIDCVTCHSGADEHARRRAAHETQGADPLSSADPRRSGLESCARCHLQGDSSIAIGAPLRGIPPPDADLFAARAVFVPAHPSSEIGFVSHVERLALSKCFRAAFGTPRELLCTTCHDPHRASTDADERRRARAACTKCHASGAQRDEHGSACALAPEKRADRACVECHMRTTGVFDVANVRIHDHRIERTPPPASAPASLRVKATTDGQLARFAFGSDASTDASVDPGLWLMAYLEIGERERAWALASKDPGAVADALPTFHHLRADLRESRGDLAGAESDLRRALELDPEMTESATNLGMLLVKEQRNADAITVLTRAIDRHPLLEGALRNRAIAWLGSNDPERGIRDLEAAFRILPQGAVARLISQVHSKLGHDELAQHWRDESRRVEPTAR